MNGLKQALQQAANKITAARMSNHPVAKCVLLDEASEIIDAALAKPEPDPVAFWHKRNQDDEKFIHAEAVNGYCQDCEPLYLSASASSTTMQSAELAAVIAERDQLRDAITEECMLTECVSPSGDPRDVLKRLTTWHAETGAALAEQRQPLAEDAAVRLVQSVVSTSDRPIGMVAYGMQVLRAVERAHGISAAATTPSAPRAPADPR